MVLNSQHTGPRVTGVFGHGPSKLPTLINSTANQRQSIDFAATAADLLFPVGFPGFHDKLSYFIKQCLFDKIYAIWKEGVLDIIFDKNAKSSFI